MDPGATGFMGFPSFSELVHSQMAEHETAGDLQAALDLIDHDRTGKINFKNLKSIARELGRP
jgi:Ca2+-binding EF-hand superfamily protein